MGPVKRTHLADDVYMHNFGMRLPVRVAIAWACSDVEIHQDLEVPEGTPRNDSCLAL
jgi:hypothetical protein